eukprot:1842450-Pleurochrysis_carterae.AAC.1
MDEDTTVALYFEARAPEEQRRAPEEQSRSPPRFPRSLLHILAGLFNHAHPRPRASAPPRAPHESADKRAYLRAALW